MRATTHTPPVTQTETTNNPHSIGATVMGWTVIATVPAALYGATTQPEAAEWSAFAVTAAVALYAVQKIRTVAWDRHTR